MECELECFVSSFHRTARSASPSPLLNHSCLTAVASKVINVCQPPAESNDRLSPPRSRFSNHKLLTAQRSWDKVCAKTWPHWGFGFKPLARRQLSIQSAVSCTSLPSSSRDHDPVHWICRTRRHRHSNIHAQYNPRSPSQPSSSRGIVDPTSFIVLHHHSLPLSYPPPASTSTP